jgi:hypothetical protein
VFSLAYVILPFSDTPPADAIRASLARFQRGLRGDIPDEWLAFADETDALRQAHETRFTFTDKGKHGLQVEGGHAAFRHIDTGKVRDEMRRRGRDSWSVRFADFMDLDTFFGHYGRDLERHPATGGYGRWRNPLGHWDWWDLGGRFDGRILGERSRGEGRRTAAISSGDNPGRAILANVEDALRDALDQPPVATVDVRGDRNIELASTLLADAKDGRDQAYPGALVLPPGAVTDHSRWLDTWPEPGPARAFGWLGLGTDATWEAVVEAAYARFHDHWVAGVAYHH